MADTRFEITRRALVAAVPALAAPRALGAPAAGALRFAAFRNGDHIGEQVMSFATAAGVVTVTTAADFAVKLGPIVVYRYRHEALERWTGDAFAALETRTNQNGQALRVSAVREATRVAISPASGPPFSAPPAALPFTHWNRRIAAAPLFNPQDGKALREQVSGPTPGTLRLARGAVMSATRYVFRGDAYIEDYYGADGAWTGLVGRLADGSTMEYRRL